MSVQLRVVIDQAGQIVDADLARAALSLTAGLIETAPRGCVVSAIVPSGGEVPLEGIRDVRALALGRRELAAAWPMGIAPGVGGGLIHAPSLMAPLVRHDRVHDNDQTTITLWDLRAWEAPETLPKATVAWQRAMLKRAVKHADAVVVPSHEMAQRLVDIAALGDRVRVIAGAQPQGFRVPRDADARRDRLQLPSRYVLVDGDDQSREAGFRAAAKADIDAVVLDAVEGAEPNIVDAASAAGLPERRTHVRGALDDEDRASVIGGAAALVATSSVTGWPWRAVEAMALKVPLVAVDSGVHQDVIADGGALVAEDRITDALVDALGAGEKRLRVLGSDRSRAFSWSSSAERVWALHAEL